MTSNFRATFAFASMLLATSALAAPQGQGEQVAPVSHSKRFGSDIVLPFYLNEDGLPLIEGAVDGKTGVFLLDTGNSDRFLLNRSYVPLDAGIPVGGGTFASGQTVVLRRHSGVHTAELSGVISVTTSSGDRKTPDATLSIDARQSDIHIDPRLLGWLGWGFLKNYVTTIEYRSGIVRLAPIATAPPSTRSNADLVVSFIPSSPVVPFTADVGGYATPAILDTAGWDRLALQPLNWTKITAANVVEARPGVGCILVKSAAVGGEHVDLVDFERTERKEERLTLGAEFLRLYTSVWDPRDGTVTLTPNGSENPPRKDCS